MATAFKKRPRPIEKGNAVDSEVNVNLLRQAVTEVKTGEPEKTNAVAAETSEASVTKAKVKTDQNCGLGQHGKVRKPNPDFEPEFDGDLEHVSWVPMKLFGHHKGF